jgi:dihydrofolate reductase
VRRLRYQVAMSLDGYIAGPKGEIDWITGDSSFDFEAHFAQFDTLVMGRGTYAALEGGAGGFPGMRIVVVSRTLRPIDHPGVEIVAEDVAGRLVAMKQEPGRDLWLFGGGSLFRSLLEAGVVDTVEPAVIPVLLGEGIPVVAGPGVRQRLRLTKQRTYDSMVLLEYDVVR